MSYYEELIGLVHEQKPNKRKLAQLKLQLCKKYKLKHIPTDMDVLMQANAEERSALKPYLQSKPQRSISGVAPVAIFAKPSKCPHGTCTYCPGGRGSVFGDVPQAYTGKEPATRRAIRNLYDPYLQVMNRLEQYLVLGHTPEKVDLIIMGGTFPAFPRRYKEEFITLVFKAMNDFSDLFFTEEGLDSATFLDFFELPGELNDKERADIVRKKVYEKKAEHPRSLEEEQQRNETSAIRCIGLTIETRPDNAQLIHANEMLRFGCTRIEMGVQTVYDDVLITIKRKQTVQDAIESTRILKDLGFKMNYHMMPGLPGVNREKDLAGLRKIFEDPSFRPDMLKMYPCMVMKGTEMYDDWVAGRYKPLSTEEAADLIAEFKQYVPEYVRIMRVQRDIPSTITEDGVMKTNLRQIIEKKLKEKNITCRCIRCREVGRHEEAVGPHTLVIQKYEASQGTEFFISAEKSDMIIGFCRLRFPSQSLREEITEKSALIREVHVYGEATPLGKEGTTQHRGIGKELIAKAEEIAKEQNKEKMVVISGVGVRGYYRKLGYDLEGPYMVKSLL